VIAAASAMHRMWTVGELRLTDADLTSVRATPTLSVTTKTMDRKNITPPIRTVEFTWSPGENSTGKESACGSGTNHDW